LCCRRRRRRRVFAGQAVPGVQRVGNAGVLRGVAQVRDVGGRLAMRRRGRLSVGRRVDRDRGGRGAGHGVRRGGHRAPTVEHCRPAEQRVRRADRSRRRRRKTVARERCVRVRGHGDGDRVGPVGGRRGGPAGPVRGRRRAVGVRAGGRGAGGRRVRVRVRVLGRGGRVPRRRRPTGPVGRGGGDGRAVAEPSGRRAPAAAYGVARLPALLPAGRPSVRVLRPRPGRRPDRQHAVLRRVRVRDDDFGVRVVRRDRRRRRVLLEPGAGVSAGVRLVPHRVHIVPGREDQTSGTERSRNNKKQVFE